MKSLKTIVRSLLVLALLAGALSAQPAPPAAAPGAPAAPQYTPKSLSDAFAVVQVGDVVGLIDRVGGLVQIFNPGFGADAIKALIGMQLNDAALAGLPTGSGMVAAVFQGGMMTFIEVAPAQMEAYKTAMAGKTPVLETVDGLLVASTEAGWQAQAKSFAAEAKKLLQGASAPKFQATIYMDRVFGQMGPQIDQVLLAMGAAEIPEMSRIMQRAMITAARDMETLSIDLDIAPVVAGKMEGIKFDFAVKPKAGTDLAAFLTAPAGKPTTLVDLLPGNGVIRGAFALNPETYAKIVEQYSRKAFAELKTTPAEQEKFLAMTSKSMAMYGGEGAMSFLIPGQALMSGSYAVRVKNPETALAGFEAIAASLKDLGKAPATGAAADATPMIQAEFLKNVRQHKTVAIHQFKMKQQLPAGMPTGPEAKALESLTDIQYEMAIVGDVMVVALGGQKIEELIDAAQAKSHPGAKALASATEFPNAKGVFDVDPGLLGIWTSDMAKSFAPAGGGGEEVNKVAAALKGVRPITGGYFSDAAGARLNLRIPGDVLTKTGQAIQQIQKDAAAAMAGPGGGAPAPAPGQ